MAFADIDIQQLQQHIVSPPRDSKALSHVLSVPVFEGDCSNSIFDQKFTDRLSKSCQFEKQVYIGKYKFKQTLTEIEHFILLRENPILAAAQPE